MIIDAEIYGMIPNAKMEARESTTTEHVKQFNDGFPFCCWNNSASTAASIQESAIGAGTEHNDGADTNSSALQLTGTTLCTLYI